MAKKQVAVTLRKPPQSNPAAVDAFVASATAPAASPNGVSEAAAFFPAVSAGGAASSAAPGLSPPTSPALESVVVRPDGRAFREMTVYLPTEVARRLSMHCLEADRDVSNVLTDMIRVRLDPPVATPVRPSSKRLRLREAVLSLRRFSPWAV